MSSSSSLESNKPSRRAARLSESAIETKLSPRARVLRHLRRSIESGTIAQSEMLPSAKSLSESLGVDRRTVHAALDMLAEEGTISSNGGRARLVAKKETRSVLANSIALLTPTSDEFGGNARQNSGWPRFIALGVRNEIARRHFHAFTLSAERLMSEDLERLIKEQPLGVIVTDLGYDDSTVARIVQTLRSHKIPCVIYGDYANVADMDHVTSDHEAGSYALTKWLLSQGHQRIACLWPEEEHTPYWVPLRQAGYEKAMCEAGLAPLPVVAVMGIDNSGGEAAFRKNVRLSAGCLIEHLTGKEALEALLVPTDGHIPFVAAACRLLGREPNRNVALVGYDNYWPDLQERQWEATPPLATVDKENFRAGEEMVNLLLKRKEGLLDAAPQRRLIAPRLVIVNQEDV